jgi:hypothetical protein
MCLPFLNLFVRYDALSRGWCVAYVRDVSVSKKKRGLYVKVHTSSQLHCLV